MTPQDIVAEILNVGTDMKATGEGPKGIAKVAADADIDWDTSLRDLRELFRDDAKSDRCEAILVGAVAGRRLARNQDGRSQPIREQAAMSHAPPHDGATT